MTPVFQTLFGGAYDEIPGNCWQAIIASLLDLPLEDVPHFMLHDDFQKSHDDFLLTKGFINHTYLNNPLRLGVNGCFIEFQEKVINSEGVNGFFSATVYSPRYFTPEGLCNYDKPMGAHAVIIDKGFNIVHDPHPEYQGIKQYPLHQFISVNGVVGVDMITPK
jgi:hypothetical protein